MPHRHHGTLQALQEYASRCQQKLRFMDAILSCAAIKTHEGVDSMSSQIDIAVLNLLTMRSWQRVSKLGLHDWYIVQLLFAIHWRPRKQLSWPGG